MNTLKQTLIILTAAVLITAVIASGALLRLDKWVQDTLYQHPAGASADIVIIGIDDAALERYGTWPWSRDVIADVLMILASDPEHKPAAVAVDVLFAGDTSASSDAYLADAAAYLGCVVTASAAEYGESITWEEGSATRIDSAAVIGYTEPYAALKDVTVRGHINAMPDRDGILRHALLYVEPGEGTRVCSMAFETARMYLEKQGREIVPPPVNAAGHFYVPFSSVPGGYWDGVSVADLMDYKVSSSWWDGRIVLIGPYAAGLQDRYFTSADRAEPMYGVEFQANVIRSLIDGDFKAEVPDAPQVIVLLLLTALAAVLFVRLRLLSGGLVCLGMTVGGIALCVGLYALGLVTHPLWLPVAVPVLFVVSLVLRYLRAVRERQALALKEERIKAELSLAARIQENALPKEDPPFPDRHEFDICASMTPAKEVGGDFYDYFLMDGDHLCLVVGDVSGKGVPGALFMMVARTLIHHVAMREGSPARILEAVNREICSRNPEEMFVTVWLGVLEISTGKMTCANAGHEYPAVKKAEGSFELLKDRHGLVVGGMDIARYREYEIPMAPGDKVFIYSDGVPEAMNDREEFYTTDRMIPALQKCGAAAPGGILEAMADSVGAFVGEAPRFDDMTMLCLEYRGAAAGGDGAGEGTAAAQP